LWQPVELIVASEHGNFQHSEYALSRPDGKEQEPGLWKLEPRITKADDPEPILIICRSRGFMIALSLRLQFDRQSVDGKKDTEPYQFRQLRRFWAPVERPKPLTRCQGFWTSAPYFHRQAPYLSETNGDCRRGTLEADVLSRRRICIPLNVPTPATDEFVGDTSRAISAAIALNSIRR
jgi:hypothetical protein